MKNGTSTAVLVRDLFRGDGPFVDMADDFLVQRCSFCRLPVSGDAQFTLAGYWCPSCLSTLVEGSKRDLVNHSPGP